MSSRLPRMQLRNNRFPYVSPYDPRSSGALPSVVSRELARSRAHGSHARGGLSNMADLHSLGGCKSDEPVISRLSRTQLGDARGARDSADGGLPRKPAAGATKRGTHAA